MRRWGNGVADVQRLMLLNCRLILVLLLQFVSLPWRVLQLCQYIFNIPRTPRA